MKRRLTLGIDTSNYTTSAALFNIQTGKIEANIKILLEVGSGERGLRQSEALFSHIKNLPEISRRLSEYYSYDELCAVGVSVKPRDGENSYMPVFLAGKSAAYMLASGGVSIYEFSHQSGHVAAALWHSGRHGLMREEFFAFHVSGGTTELLLVKPSASGFEITLAGETGDINAGQLIDRAGVMMGLGFPCGPELEKLAAGYAAKGGKNTISQKVTVKENDGMITCNLSGAENKVEKALREGADKGEAAMFVLDFTARTLDKMTEKAKEYYGERPVLYAGGVMSNAYIKEYIGKRHDAAFAPPEFSSDNAAGTAILAALKGGYISCEREP